MLRVYINRKTYYFLRQHYPDHSTVRPTDIQSQTSNQTKLRSIPPFIFRMQYRTFRPHMYVSLYVAEVFEAEKQDCLKLPQLGCAMISSPRLNWKDQAACKEINCFKIFSSIICNCFLPENMLYIYNFTAHHITLQLFV